MARYALINTDTNALIELREYATRPTDPKGKPRKWLPCPPVARSEFDALTEKVTGPTYTVGETDVTEVWTKVSLSAQEISDAKDGALARLDDGYYMLTFKALLNLHNRVRTLEGLPTHNAAQFRSALKTLL